MYKNEFDNSLKQGKKYKAYLFYGQSIFLIEQYSLAIAQMFGQSDEIEKLYFDDYDFKYAKDKLLQSSLFSSNNVLLIKTEKKIPKKELDSLVEALKFLEYEANILQMKYESNALSHLYFMHKNDLSLCVNDLKKLAVLNENITIGVVDSNCFGMATVNFEDFLHDLLSGKDISDDLSGILEEGTNEIFILNQITSFVQQLFMISSYARSFGQANPKEILGYIPPKNIWEKKSKLAINRKPQDFEEILNYLLSLELELKIGKIDNINLYLQASLRKFTVLFR
jgi:DNA polymerase-3 subunit delta